ncbi:hypothetical protein Tco_1436077 [Tanacetum coccineum]
MQKLLLVYISVCSRSKVKACVVNTENDQVLKGIVDEAGAAALKTVELDAALEGHLFQYREESINNGLLLSMLFELHVAFCYWLGILNNGILYSGRVILRGISTTTDSIE